MIQTSSGPILALIGAGVMGEAAVRGLLGARLFAQSSIVVGHPRPERRDYLHRTFGITCLASNREAVRQASIVILAIKPQVLPSVLQDLKGAIQSEAFVLSMVAGARIETIVRALEHPAVVRCMPNTPAQVASGMTVWTATPQVSPDQRGRTKVLLAALGSHLYVQHEDALDMATAVSGTGPAYVFLLMEALIDAAVHLGFSRTDARTLVLQTIKGAAAFAEHAGGHPAELRNMVTSPGGTTAAALYQLEKGGFRTVVSKAVWAAFQRSVALGSAGPNGAAPSVDGESPNGHIIDRSPAVTG